MYRVLMSGLSALHHESPKCMSQWREDKIRRLQITTRSFRFVFGKLILRLPVELASGDPRKKKKLISNWIRENIPWDKKWDGLDEALNESEDSDNE